MSDTVLGRALRTRKVEQQLARRNLALVVIGDRVAGGRARGSGRDDVRDVGLGVKSGLEVKHDGGGGLGG